MFVSVCQDYSQMQSPRELIFNMDIDLTLGSNTDYIIWDHKILSNGKMYHFWSNEVK